MCLEAENRLWHLHKFHFLDIVYERTKMDPGAVLGDVQCRRVLVPSTRCICTALDLALTFGMIPEYVPDARSSKPVEVSKYFGKRSARSRLSGDPSCRMLLQWTLSHQSWRRHGAAPATYYKCDIMNEELYVTCSPAVTDCRPRCWLALRAACQNKLHGAGQPSDAYSRRSSHLR